MMERWLPIEGHERRYEVSDQGRVRNAETGRMLLQRPMHAGYYEVSLHRDGKHSLHRVHRLVAFAFVPNPEGKPYVNHMDCVRIHNHADNLEWVTTQENQDHAWENGRYHAATNPRRAKKLTPEIVAECRRRYAAGETQKALAKEFGCNITNMYHAISGKPRDQRGRDRRASRPPMTAEIAGRIKGLHATGVSPFQCAKIVGVGTMTAWRVVNGKRWKDAPSIPPETGRNDE